MVETFVRKQTRMERYREKKSLGYKNNLPIMAGVVNFGKEVNYAQAMRAASCFGCSEVHLIGNCDIGNSKLRSISGTTHTLVPTIQHKSPVEFVEWCRFNNIKIICLELPQDCGLQAMSLNEYKFDFEHGQNYIIVSGSESSGIPLEILINGDILFIPMFGQSYCLNTACSLNIGLYEATSQYSKFIEN